MIRKRRFTRAFLISIFSIVFIVTIQTKFNIYKDVNHELSVVFTTAAIKGKGFPTTTRGLDLRPKPKRLVHEVSCEQIIEGNKQHISFASNVSESLDYKYLTDKDIRKLAQDCEKFLEIFDYNRFTVSQEELDFPLAFSIIAHKDAVQIEMLLRAIYRPHNVYCIHVDRSSDSCLLEAMKAISKCLPNILIASKLEDIIYEGYSRLQADLNCMADLLNKTDVDWKYLINLPAQEYPLKTNAEIVKIFKIFNGTSSIESIYHEGTHYRVNETYRVNPKTLKMEGTGRQKDPPPYNTTVGKGNAYGAFSRRFVHFALNDEKAQGVLEWTKDTFSPDETFWATLVMNKHLGAPGIKYTGMILIFVNRMLTVEIPKIKILKSRSLIQYIK